MGSGLGLCPALKKNCMLIRLRALHRRDFEVVCDSHIVPIVLHDSLCNSWGPYSVCGERMHLAVAISSPDDPHLNYLRRVPTFHWLLRRKLTTVDLARP